MRKKYLTAAAAAALMISAAGITHAQTPPSTDRPRGTSEQVSANPKMDKGGMKGMTRKSTKSKRSVQRTARVTKRAPAKKQDDSWWNWNWNDNQKGNRW